MSLPPIEGLAELDDAALAGLREALRTGGYDGRVIADSERIAPGLFDALRLPLVRRFLRNLSGPASDLALLLAYRTAVPAERVRAALGDSLTDRLIRAELLETNGESIVSRFILMAFEDNWYLSDYLDADRDAVMGPGMTTLLLHRALAHSNARTVLDLGCGAASLAIAAAQRGAQAFATDLSARAVGIAKFNARLNGVVVDCRQGDCAAPVAGLTFDLILSQPPYVPLPQGAAGSTFLHGGRYGDELALRFAGECAGLLSPGGMAFLHFDSAVRQDAPLAERLRVVTASSLVDSMALVEKAPSLDHQAVAYAASTFEALDERYQRAVVDYREHLESMGASEMSRLLLVLRRPPEGGEPGGRYRLVLPAPSLTKLRGDAVMRLVSALELALSSEKDLLGSRVEVPKGARFVEERESADAPMPVRFAVRMPEGSIAQDRELGERGWALFGLLGSGLTIGEALVRFAEMCGEPAAVLRGEVIGFVREGLARGLLEPSEQDRQGRRPGS
ncbi:MAG: methyltransferase [Deltaproteobacteria bacterium]|nr:methyltransferase [Deltaproteobacteria bacterium]